MPIALLSVTDKTGIEKLGADLVRLGYSLVSTGGTAQALQRAGLPVQEVSELTGFPEMLGGRVKTLHPRVHGGILGDLSLTDHVTVMQEAGIEPISIVVVNLYRFEETVRKTDSLDERIEAIDIGGPAMIRSAAKNHKHVWAVVDPDDYEALVGCLESCEDRRLEFAAKAFRHTALYDSVISSVLSANRLEQESLTIPLRLRQLLRYGENPHQRAGLFVDPVQAGGVAQAKQLSGKELSYNNLLDSDSAWLLAMDLAPGSCAIIKHGNPCGAASKGNCAKSYSAARESDPISAFGGVAAFNGTVDLVAAEACTAKGNFLEVILAQAFTPDAVELIGNRSGWGTNVRLLQVNSTQSTQRLQVRSISGGALVQDFDLEPEGTEFSVVTERAPSAKEREALLFLWKIVKHVHSNAIVIGNEAQLLGVGAGQMNRVQSVRLAIEGAGERVQGSALASDAFFPFPDSVETAAASGVTAFIQPGGSKKDQEVIDAANRANCTMLFSGVRHFRH